MKICMLTTGHSALDDRIFHKEALSLKKIYDKVTIIAPDDNELYYEKGIKIIGIKKSHSLFERLKLTKIVIKKAIEEKADVYHFHDFELIYLVMRIKKYLPNSKIIYDVHEHYPDMIAMSKKIPSLLKIFAVFFVDKSEIFMTKKFDFLITADDAVKVRLEKYNKNIQVIYNFSEYNPKISSDIKKEYDIIYQGGITLERGVFEAVKAIQIVKKKFNNVKMIFVGPFDDILSKNQVFEYIKTNDLENNIIFTGKVLHSEVENYIRKSRIGLVALLPYPKYYKNIPIKQFEYMSCGIPVIGSDLPPIKKFIESYNSGIIVDPLDPNNIANAEIKLLEDSELCSKLGENGVRAVKEMYNWSNMESKLLKIYNGFDIQWYQWGEIDEKPRN